MWSFAKLDGPRVFVAAPSDLNHLRAAARGALKELKARTADDQGIEVFDFVIDVKGFRDGIPPQVQIPPTSDPNCKAVICMFGERIGTPLTDDVPLDPLGGFGMQTADAPYRLLHPWPESPADQTRAAEAGAFPLTGTVFECLAALNTMRSGTGSRQGKPPLRVLFIGREGILGDGDVEDAGWGHFRLQEEMESTYSRDRRREFRNWCVQHYRPQLVQLRNFLRFLQSHGIYPEPVGLDHDQAREEIRLFLEQELPFAARPDDRPRFKGLGAYDCEDHDIYWGRAEERARAVRQLEALWVSSSPTFFGIEAASGVGKSSFLRAGLIGHMRTASSCRSEHTYDGVVVRPPDLMPAEGTVGTTGVAENAHDVDARSSSTAADSAPTNPLLRLVSLAVEQISTNGAASDGSDVAGLTRDLAALKNELQPAAAVRLLEEVMSADRLLIGLDQFEEIVDERAVPALRERWQPLVDFITAAATSAEKRIGIVYTLQANRGDVISLDPELGPLWKDGQAHRLTFPESNLKEIICKPFENVGVTLEPQLADALESRIWAFADGPGNRHGRASLLPLVSVALQRIYNVVAVPALAAARTSAAPVRTQNAAADAPADGSARDVSGSFSAATESASKPADGLAVGALPAGLDSVAVRLGKADCEGLLDVETAIADLAEGALARAKKVAGPDWSDEETLAGLLDRLVRSAGLRAGHFSFPSVPLPAAGARRILAEELVDSRLLIQDPERAGHVQLVHEAILMHWPPAREWLEDRRDLLKLEAEVSFFAGSWEDSGYDPDQLVAHEADKAAELLARQWESFSATDVSAEVRLLRSFGLALLAAHPTPLLRIANTKGGTHHIGVAAAYGDTELVRRYIEVDPQCVHVQNNDKRTALFAPSFDGNEEMIQLLIDAGAAVDQTDVNDWQPVHAAAAAGRLGALKRLVSQDASSHVPGGPSGVTPLHVAAAGGRDEIVAWLLSPDVGADPKAVDRNGWTPLHSASDNGHVAAARLLLDHDAAAGAQLYGSKITPLYLAAQANAATTVSLLLDYSADPNAPAQDGRTALHIAAQRGYVAVAEALLRAETPCATDARVKGQCPIHVAAENGHAAVVRILLDSGADSNAKDGDGRTALHIAAAKGFSDVVRALSGRCDIAALDESGYWPLRAALRAGNVDMARLLIDELHASVDHPRERDWSLIHLAALSGSVSEGRVLLRLGADPNTRGTDEATPLHLAAEAGREEFVQLLLGDERVDISARERGGVTPLHVAAERGHSGVVAAILERFPETAAAVDDAGFTPLHYAIQAGNPKIVEVLLGAASPGDETATVEDSRHHVPPVPTPLQTAAEVGDVAVIALLIARGAPVGEATAGKPLPLILAVRNGHYAAALRLLEAGATLPAGHRSDDRLLFDLFSAYWLTRGWGNARDGTIAAEVWRRLDLDGVPLVTGPATVEGVTAQPLESAPGPDGPHSGDVVLRYQWAPAGEELRLRMIRDLGRIDDGLDLSEAGTRIDLAALPFYRTVRLLRMTDESWPVAGLAIYYLLSDAGESYRLDGSSPPIHEANSVENIELSDSCVLDYLRFFCYFVRGDDGPFHIAERLDDAVLPPDLDESLRTVIGGVVRPASCTGRDNAGNFLCDATVFYSSSVYDASFIIQQNGMIEMDDDDPVTDTLPVRIHSPIVYEKPVEGGDSQ
ncbi:hypothetical protein BH23GEM9_BH23GEM9_30460 [soil metagenome]